MTTRLNRLNQPIGQALPDWSGAQQTSPMTLNGNYCQLAPLNCQLHGDDLYDAFSLDSENRTWTYLFMGPFGNKADFKQWLNDIENKADPLFFAIINPTTQRAVGLVSYMRIDPKNGVIEVGNLVFSPQLKQTPLSTEALHLLIKHAFEKLGYRRCEWKCDSLNEPSRRAAERLGFKYEGLFRQAIVYNGRNRDTTWYSIIDSEWPQLSQAHQAWLSPSNFDCNGIQKQRLGDFIPHISPCSNGIA
ncbi:GNAT family N-acetyltransferase [Photobacterium minamisatsumaniensis]|uniref:GNAT family N-acetyltransferase n=1 Tax=Photobacterium minamisatsumaniensis TaxID=2910233 RepID=UPI003D12BB03